MDLSHKLLANAIHCITSLSKAMYIDDYSERMKEQQRVMDNYFNKAGIILKEDKQCTLRSFSNL